MKATLHTFVLKIGLRSTYVRYIFTLEDWSPQLVQGCSERVGTRHPLKNINL